MVLAKKQLSKVVAIVLVAMCAVAFMPLLNGEAFAAAKVKTPAKVVIKTAKQSGNTMKVKVTWKKANNAKTYNVKIDKKVVKKGIKKVTYTSAALKAGTHKVYVQAVNGKKTGKWSKAKSFKIVDKKAAKVTVEGEAVVGATLTATVTNKAGGVLKNATYQWYRVNNSNNVETEIPGATEATYTITAADYTTSFTTNGGYQIFVKATAGGKTVSSTKTVIVSPGYYAQLNDSAGKAVTTPCVGQTVYAAIYNAVTGGIIDADADYQWYVDGVALKGKTQHYFDITADELGKTIECKIVFRDKEYTTGVSAPVVKSTIPEEVTISGASGKDEDIQVPTVGDTLTAAFTKPENAADPDAAYQWYVGNTELKGETKATYTVQKEDINYPIRVKVTLSTGGAPLVDWTAPVVANKLSSSDYTAAVVDADTPTNTVFTTDCTVKAIVYQNNDTTKADKFEDVAGGVEWYIDSVKAENQLFKTNAGAAFGQTLDLDATVYTTKDGKTYKALENGLVGHTLIAVITGNNEDYAGSVTSAAIGPVGVKIGTLDIALNGAYAETDIIVGATTLQAAFEDANTTATYKWYKSTDAGNNYTVIAGATSASYVPTSQDAYDKVDAYKVEAVGTGNYVGTAVATLDAFFAESTAQTPVQIQILNEQGNTVSGTVRPGAKLTAACDVETAEATMTYTWTFTDVSAETTATATGATYTVPANAEAGDTVAVAATTNNPTNYGITQADALTVQVNQIKSVTLKGEGTADPAKPVIGDVITAKVDPADTEAYVLKWYYSDDMNTPVGEDASYAVTAADLGKTLVAVAEGQGNYAGTSAQATTGVVKVKVNLVATVDGEEITNNTLLSVGETIEVYAVAADDEVPYNDAVESWNWTTNGSEPAENNAYKIQNNDINGESISVTAAGPFAEGSTLTWTFRGTINQNGEY